MNQTIEIMISPTGQTRVETKGFTGASCQQASRFLEQALGQVTAAQLTAEYYRASATDAAKLQEGGAA